MSGKSKNTAVKIAIFGAILLIAGIVIFACSFPYGNSASAYSARYRVELNVDKALELDHTTELNIRSSLATEITENDGNAVTVKATGTYIRPNLFGKLNRIAENAGGETTIDFSQEWGFSIGFNFTSLTGEETALLSVSIPKSYAGKIVVNGLERSMKFNVSNVFSEAELTLGSGSFSGSVETAGDLSLYTTSGSMKLANVKAGGDLTARLSSGGMELNRVDAGGDVTFSTSSGGMRVGSVTAGGAASVKVASGSTRIESLTAAGSASATLSSGLMQIYRLTCGELTTKTSSGTMELSNVASTALTATLSSGGNSFQLTNPVSVEAKIASGSMKVSMPQPAGTNMKLHCKISSGSMKDYYFTNAKHGDTFDAYIGNPAAADALRCNVTISSGGFTLTAI